MSGFVVYGTYLRSKNDYCFSFLTKLGASQRQLVGGARPVFRIMYGNAVYQALARK
jgi:hypothetical protein